jgi:NTP pyrophosphatase (non-canonical NTP hydrolase)
MKELQILQDEIQQWANKTFGKDWPVTAPLHHLKKEVDETIEAINNEQINTIENDHDFTLIRKTKTEFADCFILLLNAASRYGMSVADLHTYAKNKMALNRSRSWGKPDENGVVEHIRDGK